MKKLLAVLDAFEKTVCCFFLALILVFLTYQVVTRYVLNSPSLVSEEIARYLYIAFVYISMSYAERENAHIRIEVLHKVFPKILRKYVLLLGGLVFLGFSAVMSWICTEQAIEIYSSAQTSLSLDINLGYVYGTIAVGYIAMTIRICINILSGRYTSPKSREPDAEPPSRTSPSQGARRAAAKEGGV